VVDAAGGQPRRLSSPAYDEHIPGWSGMAAGSTSRGIEAVDPRSGVCPHRAECPRRSRQRGVRVRGESWDGTSIYYLKNLPIAAQPLYARSLAGGAERQVLDSVYGRCFHIVADGIYHFAGADDQGAYPLQFFDFATGRTGCWPGSTCRQHRPHRLPGPENHPLHRYKPINYDLVLVENFR